MNKRSRFGCFLLGGILLLLLLAAGGWFWYRSIPSARNSIPPSPVLVFLLTPSSGDEMQAGNFVPVALQAAAPTTIQSAELFVDGQSQGSITDSPENALWTWQAWPLGVHTLRARVISQDGQAGESQTVIVNVLAGNSLMRVAAEEGQTLERIGADFGVLPDQMVDANPHIDPSQPLPGGQPVDVPVGGGNAGGGGAGSKSGPGGGQGQSLAGADLPPLISIVWDIKFSEPVDKSYCYTSSGDGNWEKMPKDPFDFFQSQDNLYTQLIPPAEKMALQADCWGWLGGVLKYLGQAQTTFDLDQPPQNVTLTGSGFQFSGALQIPMSGGGPMLDVPPPYALREPMNAADCTAHAHPLLAPFICKTLLDASVKEYIILEWEWAKPACWPGYCGWVDAIDGYRIYEIDPVTKAEKYLKEINNTSQKIAATPLPWGTACYGVRAYINTPAFLESEMVTYCPGHQPTPQKTVLTPNKWLTTGGQWWQDGDCDTYGLADEYVVANQNNGFGSQPGEVLVGSYTVDDDDQDCHRDGSYSGAVKFGAFLLPPNAVIQKANLKFSKVFNDYGASGVALGQGENPFCAAQLGTAKQDWTAVGSPIHFWGDNILAGYSNPITSLSGWAGVDVTPIVIGWGKHPEQDHGFILTPAPALHPAVDGSGSCLSGASVQLEIFYFAP